jgi:hypothetical protein
VVLRMRRIGMDELTRRSRGGATGNGHGPNWWWEKMKGQNKRALCNVRLLFAEGRSFDQKNCLRKTPVQPWQMIGAHHVTGCSARVCLVSADNG